jgi:preprotein translocase subunit YajC
MTLTPALVLAAVTAPSGLDGFFAGPVGQMIIPLAMFGVLFYFMLWRPQQQRQRDHVNKIQSIKRGDTVVLSNGMKGKVVRVEDAELGVEIAQNVTVKVVKTMVHDVQTRGEPAPANDAKS